MSELEYKGQEWRGMIDNDEELLLVRMSDATFQRHLNAYLERIGVPTLSYLQLIDYVHTILEQRFQAGQYLSNLSYWLSCDDPEVRVFRRTKCARILESNDHF